MAPAIIDGMMFGISPMFPAFVLIVWDLTLSVRVVVTLKAEMGSFSSAHGASSGPNHARVKVLALRL
jgi:hypothetical protein